MNVVPAQAGTRSLLRKAAGFPAQAGTPSISQKPLDSRLRGNDIYTLGSRLRGNDIYNCP